MDQQRNFRAAKRAFLCTGRTHGRQSSVNHVRHALRGCLCVESSKTPIDQIIGSHLDHGHRRGSHDGLQPASLLAFLPDNLSLFPSLFPYSQRPTDHRWCGRQPCLTCCLRQGAPSCGDAEARRSNSRDRQAFHLESPTHRCRRRHPLPIQAASALDSAVSSFPVVRQVVRSTSRLPEI